MKWLEVIQLRSSVQGVEAIRRDLKAYMSFFRSVKHLEHVSVLAHVSYDEDLAVVFVWSKDHEPEKTQEGHFIAKHLVQYGAVNHSVWKVVLDVDTSPCDSKLCGTAGDKERPR